MVSSLSFSSLLVARDTSIQDQTCAADHLDQRLADFRPLAAGSGETSRTSCNE